jgi:ABC-type dipeptide/oligopeptide/nickel transport system permease component
VTTSTDNIEKAAELRLKAMHAARAGRVEEARAALLESSEHDPNDATAFLWLAGLAASEREAYQFLERARQLDPDHPQLARAAEGIHAHFSRKRKPQPPIKQPSLAAEPQVERIGPALHLPEGLLVGVANAVAPFIWRILSMVFLLLAVIFFVALLMELGREGDLRTLPVALPAAAEFTGEYLQGVAHGDLGQITSSLGSRGGTPVLTELGRALPKSLGLLAVSLALAALVGIYLGIIAAMRRHSRLSGLVLFASAFGVSTPSYFAAMLLIWLGVWLYKNTGQHVFPVAGFGWDAHLLLPALVLAARPAAVVTRLSYNALLEILDADYIRTAKSKGLKQGAILLEHVLRNAGVPILTTVVVSLRFSLAILPIVEYIFSWPGIGRTLLIAIQTGDVVAAVGMILPLALVFVLVNLIANFLYLRLDPRLRNAKVGRA